MFIKYVIFSFFFCFQEIGEFPHITVFPRNKWHLDYPSLIFHEIVSENAL